MPQWAATSRWRVGRLSLESDDDMKRGPRISPPGIIGDSLEYYYVGIDVSWEPSSVCVMDATGRVVREAKVAKGWSWTGLHRHALMTLITFAFLQHRRLTAARHWKNCTRTTASAEPTCRAAGSHCAAEARPSAARALSHCRRRLSPPQLEELLPK
jgi:hypothetical protein